MRSRREFITLLGGAAGLPLAARAQQPGMPVVGFLGVNSAAEWVPFVTAFRDGLKEAGYTEGQNVAVEYRWGEGHIERLPAQAAELVGRRVAVIVGANVDAALAAKAATTTIPIVFVSGGDPVQSGLVASFNRPTGNVTGVNFFSDVLVAKRLGLLHDLLPRATRVALLVNPNARGTLGSSDQLRDAEGAARALGMQTIALNASTADEINTAFAALDRQPADALVVAADPVFTARRYQIVALAARRALPAIYSVREWSSVGGLMSYSTSLTDAHEHAGVYVGRILNGAKPGDLPVFQATKFELVINLQTAKALGLEVPPTLLARADEVIE
jgi:putative ABC transport system substrate-binding protein